MITDVDGLEKALRQWQCTAREVWATLIGGPAPYAPPRFRWEAAAGQLAKQHLGATHFSAVLRALARRAEEMAKVLTNHSPTATFVAHRHLNAARLDLAPTKGDEALSARRWLTALQGAVQDGNVGKIIQLQGVADRKAKKLEDAAT